MKSFSEYSEGLEVDNGKYVPFFETQKAILAWIYETFNCPVFQWWNYLWHLVVKAPVQLLIHSFVMGIGPDGVVKSYYIVILGHVMWSGPWILKDFCQVPRPGWVLPFGFNYKISERNWSFPSGHTFGISGTFLIIALIWGQDHIWLWFLYVLMTFLTCLARTALRMHWPLDTFGSSMLAPPVVLPLYFFREKIFTNHIDSSSAMLNTSIIVFAIFFLSHVIAHTLVMTYLPVPEYVRHVASDPTRFKYTNFMGGIRNTFFLSGIGFGIFAVWKIRGENLENCPFDQGIVPALYATASTGFLLLIQNFFRNWVFETVPWTKTDYMIKWIFAPLIGFSMIITSAGFKFDID